MSKSNFKAIQQTLFDQDNEKTLVKTLTISNNKQKVLSKEQLQFNKLTKRIENLEKSIETETARCEGLYLQYKNKVYPLHTKAAQVRIQLAQTLGEISEKYKFSKAQVKMIKETILDMCNNSFQIIEPTQEQEKFYNYWSDTSYEEEVRNQEQETKDLFSDMMEQMFGIEVNPEMLDGNPDKMGEIIEQLKQNLGQEKGQKERKKTKKQIETEAIAKAEEAIKNKGVRSIYIALAKVLHPDTEQDQEMKAEKEELMKKVTVAFEQKDLPTLLKLELEWVHKENEHLNSLTEEKLIIYISVLKQQTAELEQKRSSIFMNPRYSEISDLIRLTENQAKRALQEMRRELESMNFSLHSFLKQFQRPNQKMEIIDFLNEYAFMMDEEEPDLDFFDEFFN